MKIATWNVAGIRARHDTLIKWLKQSQVDVVCLQETKTIDANFPRAEIEALGYNINTHGQKGFNGVALLSKINPDEVICGLPGDDSDEQARYIEAVYSTKTGVIRIVSLYVPNGNPVDSEKYPYKLRWYERFYDRAVSLLALEEPLIFAGDYNVIDSAFDAKNPQEWEGDALYLPKSREALWKIKNLGFYDATRSTSDNPDYSFWDFKSGAWQKNDGIRIDHFFISPEAADKLETSFVERAVRGWDKPSDHVPVVIELR
ncbi:exodeoxyribonuclease III [Bartonella sp. M0280]|uniref:exodeoxyribonuclease III n=1 Tax=Bartonella apihabitans TaxID=2750929 RepID=UPI0018DDC3E7|nr:exodeoxyribonuclease III [Bartonella apihabitans]MBI0166760.1 exodeoxyribonuclease III [Bartonella apihabitans]